MTSKLIPQRPEDVMVIRDVSKNITTLSVPFLRFGLIRFGGRATIVRMSSGALAVFSPVALTADVTTKLRSMGDNVAYLIAPDLEHHIFLSQWHQAYPSAHVIGPEGLAEKRAADASIEHKVPFSTIFTAKNKSSTRISEEFDRDFDYEYVDAHVNKELVFYHKPDKTMIQADLIFNLPATEQYSRSGESATKGLITRLFCAVQTTEGTAVWHKRFLWYAASAKDRAGMAESARRMDKWDFNTIVPCHGDVIQGDGKGIFRKVLEWHLAGNQGGQSQK